MPAGTDVQSQQRGGRELLGRHRPEATAMSYDVGDRVRVDIPEHDDPDHRYHGDVD